MRTVNVHEAKAKLSELIERVLDGEDVVIARRNVPLVRLTAVEAAGVGRRVGWARGLVEIAPDFDQTPDDFADYS